MARLTRYPNFALTLILLTALSALLPLTAPSAQASSILRLSRVMMAPGDRLTVSGSGFVSGAAVRVSTSVHVSSGGGGTTTRTVDANVRLGRNGAFVASLLMPADTSPGAYSISAIQSSRPVATASVKVLALVILRAGRSLAVTVVAGHSFYVAGHGLPAQADVTVSAPFARYLGPAVTASQKAHTDSRGNLSEVLLRVPDGAKAGPAPVTASTGGNSQSGQNAAAIVNVVYRPYLSVGPSTVPAGGTVSASGGGFVPNAGVRLTVQAPGASNVTVASTLTAGSGGGFTTDLLVPAGAATGTYTVVARSRSSGRAPTATFSVTTAARIDLRPNPVAPGSAVQVTGAGYSPGVSVAVSAVLPLYGGGSTTLSTTALTGSRGKFSTAITIPGHAAAGTVQVTGAGPHASASASLVISHVPAHIVLSPSTVLPGSALTVLGTGYIAGDTVDVATTVRLSDGSSATLTTTPVSNGQGQFSTVLHMPSGTVLGSYSVSATSEKTGRAPTAQFAVAVAAAIQLQPSAALPNHTISVSGSGFSAGASITISATFPLYEGGSKTVSQVVNAGPHGGIFAQLAIPGHASAGTVSVSAQGPKSRATADLLVQHITAAVTVSPTSVLPGSALSVRGTGYPAGDAVVVSVDTTTTMGASRRLTARIQADSHGQFVMPFQIPSDTAVGGYSLIAKSVSTGRAPHTSFTVAVAASISLAPVTLFPGEAITVNGGGFSAGVDVVVSASIPLYGGGSSTIGATVHTGSRGGFSTHLTLPRKAASGTITITAKGPHTQRSAQAFVRRVAATLSLSPNQATPGTAVIINGSGYLPNDTVKVAVTVSSLNGTSKTLSVLATTGAQGRFKATLQIPADTLGGTYTVVGASQTSGRSPSTHLQILTLNASVVALPTTAAPGTPVSVTGLGFAAGVGITIDLQGRRLASATADGSGRFSVTVTIPSDTATGSYSLSATSSTGRKATVSLVVQRPISTHFYFASLYTGRNYEERIALLNPTTTRAHVVIVYQLTDGSVRTKSLDVPAHSRATEDVNADLGYKVSASAVVSSGVAIVAERRVLHVTDGSIVPGTQTLSRTWYFANGNTSHGYREFIAIQNPSDSQIQVGVKLLPTHHASRTIYRSLAPHSRTTVKVNSYVQDAVGVIVSAGVPVVANRTIYIAHSMTSKIGAIQPQSTWYFATGPQNVNARYWIGAINPSNQRAYVTLRAYGPFGQQLGTAQGWLNPEGRVGYLINKIAHLTNVAVVLTASHPIVAEQMTYAGKKHDAGTDTFGTSTPARSYGFAAVDTINARAFEDVLSLFNPLDTPLPITVKYFRANGTTVEKSYIVGPLSHIAIDVGSIVPDAQLGIVVASDQPFVALNRAFFNGRKGSMTSTGVPS